MSLKPRAVLLVTGLELRQRVRSVRWYVALGIWFLILMGMSILMFGSFVSLGTDLTESLSVAGAVVFSTSVFLLVVAMLLIIPALSAGAINGDRTAGTLAILQVTLLSPLEIVLGKVLAGWVTGLAFLVVALPSVIPSALVSGISVFFLLRVVVMIAVLTLFITAMGVGLSSLTQRTLGSVVLSYLLVAGVTLILPIVFVSSLPLLATKAEVTTYDSSFDGSGRCVASQDDVNIVRSDLTVFLLYVNPFVIVADTAPVIDDLDSADESDVNALSLISTGMRYLSNPLHPSYFNHCSPGEAGNPSAQLGEPTSWPVWPWGVGLYLLGAAGAVAIATFRLRTPMRRVGTGTRIA